MSNSWHLPTVLNIALAFSPKRVLDVGIGTGTYGFLLRQYLDIAHERLRKEEWISTIDGVEVFEEYRNPVWEYAYNRVYTGDVRELLPSIGEYDVILCNDVLEHFEREQARHLIGELRKRTPVFIATTPAGEWEQGAWGGNEAEIHRCVIGDSDFPVGTVKIPTGVTVCYVCASGSPAESAAQIVADLPRFKSPTLSALRRRVVNRLKRVVSAKP